MEHIERRISQRCLLEAMEKQNEMLLQLLGFIAPIAAFFEALKLVVKVAVWITGAGAAGLAVWEYIKAVAKH